MLANQGHLYRALLDHELAWKAMRGRVSLGVRGHQAFEQTHRVPDTTVKLPAVQVYFTPNPEVK